MIIRNLLLGIVAVCVSTPLAWGDIPSLREMEPAGADGNYEISWNYIRGGSGQTSKHIVQEFGFYKLDGTTKRRFVVHRGSLGFNANRTGKSKVYFPNKASEFDGFYLITKWSDAGENLIYFDNGTEEDRTNGFEEMSFDRLLGDGGGRVITLQAPSAAQVSELNNTRWQKWYPRYGGLDNIVKVFLSYSNFRRLNQCENGEDDDRDGRVDLADPACTSATDDSEFEQCRDNIDNDNDGLTDERDPGCWSNINDSSTYNPSLNNEARATSQCQDNRDNDSDGLTDERDPGCWSDIHNAATFNPKLNDEARATTQCQDNRDNDGDGLADERDPGCWTNTRDATTYNRILNNEARATSECQDNIDNDGDGAEDFPADFSCSSKTDYDETNPKAACQDGIDNDKDGLIDLNDPGCVNRQDNSEGSATTQCQDGVDNDGDGARDFPADFSCSSPTDNDEGNPKSGCQDGIDNDGDGLTDLEDPGCSSSQDNDESDKTSQCQDGIDNDSDGATDFPADFSCASKTDNDEENPKSACQDGLDNDGDGLTDLLDPGCATAQDDNEGDKTSQCQDGIDNDGDGAIDFPADFSCASKTDHDETNPKSQCQDATDNDGDGLIDNEDPGCSDKQDNEEGDKTSECQDGIDNDQDGATDFPADFSCSSKTDNDEDLPGSACQDLLDNDGDGLVDLKDPGCSTAQDNNEGDGTSQCQDGLDNDQDGLVDMADPGCTNPQDTNEGDGTSQCQDLVDNDGDGLIDLKDPGCSNPQDGNEVDDVSRLQVSLDCVYNNLNGTFTAYFGYENLLTTDTVTVTTDATAGTQNIFAPALASGSPLTRFKAGRHKGAIGVVFDGNPLVWTVQIAQGISSSATASSTSPKCEPVTPLASCIDSGAAGLLGTFGYSNPNAFTVNLPLSTLNALIPSAIDGSQTTSFLAGTNKAAFVVPFSDQVTWKLGAVTVALTPSSPVCEGGCIGTSTVEIQGALDAVALRLAELTNQAAAFLKSQAQKRLNSADAAAVARDVRRSKLRAKAFLARANELMLEFPQVVKSCPNAAQVCKTIDRQPTIDALRQIYAQARNGAIRMAQRGSFNGTRRTDRTNRISVAAKAAEQEGLVAISKLPRFATECS